MQVIWTGAQNRLQSTSRVHCNIGFGELAVNMPETHIGSAICGLIDILRDVPFIEFDKNLSWTGEETHATILSN